MKQTCNCLPKRTVHGKQLCVHQQTQRRECVRFPSVNCVNNETELKHVCASAVHWTNLERVCIASYNNIHAKGPAIHGTRKILNNELLTRVPTSSIPYTTRTRAANSFFFSEERKRALGSRCSIDSAIACIELNGCTCTCTRPAFRQLNLLNIGPIEIVFAVFCILLADARHYIICSIKWCRYRSNAPIYEHMLIY